MNCLLFNEDEFLQSRAFGFILSRCALNLAACKQKLDKFDEDCERVTSPWHFVQIRKIF